MTGQSVKAKAERLLALHAGPEVLVMPNAWDVVSAVILADLGFPAIATTSAGIAFARGYPDGQRIPRTEMIGEIERIARAVEIPVTADLEAGYGDGPEDVAETISLAISVGVVGANIEDSYPDHPDRQYAAADAALRIKTARQAADAMGIPFVINARCDNFRPGRERNAALITDAIERLNAYKKAGAECLYTPWVGDADTIARLVQNLDGPLNILAGPKTAAIGELKKLGVRRVTTGGGLYRSCLGHLEKAAHELQDLGTYDYTNGAFSHAAIDTLLGSENGK
ncbi:MAG: isocitrate lyase/phosphoenolpyruvate mutase family protein [Rhodospirillales bacterium]|nr:isocitrate lyase/phosphoenolpyruvate mutase family protein [Rhodospirillales bacterium]